MAAELGENSSLQGLTCVIEVGPVDAAPRGAGAFGYLDADQPPERCGSHQVTEQLTGGVKAAHEAAAEPRRCEALREGTMLSRGNRKRLLREHCGSACRERIVISASGAHGYSQQGHIALR